MNSRLLGFPMAIWGVLALVVAAVFVFVWPQNKVAPGDTESMRFMILRWGHTAVWVLIALSLFIRGTGLPGSGGFANLLGIAAGGIYATFVMTLIAE